MSKSFLSHGGNRLREQANKTPDNCRNARASLEEQEKGSEVETVDGGGKSTQYLLHKPRKRGEKKQVIPRCWLIFAQLEECKHNAKKSADSNVIYFYLTVPKASMLHSPKGHMLAVELGQTALTAAHGLHCR